MLDIIGILIITLSFFRGFQKGIVVALFSLASIIIGMLAALKFSASLSQWLLAKGWVSSAWVQLVAWLLLFLGVLFIARLGAKAIEQVLKATLLNGINRIIGGLLYLFIGAFVWSCLLWLGNRAHFFSPETLAASHSFPYFEPLAPLVFDKLGAILPFAKDVFHSLSQFFDDVNKQLPGHVGAA